MRTQQDRRRIAHRFPTIISVPAKVSREASVYRRDTAAAIKGTSNEWAEQLGSKALFLLHLFVPLVAKPHMTRG